LSRGQGYIFWPPPPLGGGEFFVQIEKRKNLKEDMKKRKGKEGKEEKKSDKTHVEIPL